MRGIHRQPKFRNGNAHAGSLIGRQLAAIFITGFLAVTIAALLTFGEAQSSNAVSPVEAASMAAKGDRGPSACQGQAWGAWDATCAAALSGATRIRSVGYVTVEHPSGLANETILTRVQASH
ncbi:hypothetical protein GCM10011316_16750 [Roseibium aquae]|uniref:Uncharacterized protein n=1 Tax=Roseibium aquae TaxID=1323746 RepID=A0A916WZG5_9HYPH|nr:hypothetical protein [Roseibium aquae]GGB45357.1 hypothetical protein GCM10011316_16750 [Roseibium aquae]